MIDTKALRSKVLDLAIQGKLTEQLESDGTAEELFAQIQEEKQKLIKEGKIKKEKPLPPVSSEEIPFEIPSSWKWVRFGELMRNRDSERIPVSVADRKKIAKIYDYYGASGVIDKVETYLFDKTLLLISEDGANLLSRSMPIAFLANGKYWVNNHAHVLDSYVGDYLTFVMYYINSISLVPYVTGSAQPKLNQDNMSKIPIPLPPLAEQKRIVERVEEIFKLLDIIDEAHKKYSADAKILKSKLITMGIQGKLTEQLESDGTAEELFEQIQEEKQKLIKEGKIKKEKPLPTVSQAEIPFEIPSSWKWVRLGNLSSLITKGSSPKWQGVNYTDEENGILFVTSENVGKNKMLLEKRKYIEKHFNNSHQSSIIRKGDILTNIVGASIGRTAIFDENIENANINQAVCVIRLIENSMSNYVLRYMNGCDAISLMLGKTVDTARANLSLTSVSNLIIPLPPLTEQKRIADKLDEVLRVLG